MTACSLAHLLACSLARLPACPSIQPGKKPVFRIISSAEKVLPILLVGSGCVSRGRLLSRLDK